MFDFPQDEVFIWTHNIRFVQTTKRYYYNRSLCQAVSGLGKPQWHGNLEGGGVKGLATKKKNVNLYLSYTKTF